MACEYCIEGVMRERSNSEHSRSAMLKCSNSEPSRSLRSESDPQYSKYCLNIAGHLLDIDVPSIISESGCALFNYSRHSLVMEKRKEKKYAVVGFLLYCSVMLGISRL